MKLFLVIFLIAKINTVVLGRADIPTIPSLDSQSLTVSSQSEGNLDIDYDNLAKKDIVDIKSVIERMLFSDESPEVKHEKIIKINKSLRKAIFKNIHNKTLLHQKKERRLSEVADMTRKQLRSGNDEISTSNRLAEIEQQEKSMSNLQQVTSWLDDVNFKLDDLRSNVNRRIQDMSVGLQRRSLLMGHYNYMGMGIGSPNGESMSNMNPYYHF